MEWQWYWYSMYGMEPRIGSRPPNPNGPPAADVEPILTRTIYLLQNTAEVHKNPNNFPGKPDEHVKKVHDKVKDGFLVIAYRWDGVNPPRNDDTLYFQVSKWLSMPHAGPAAGTDDPWGAPSPVWSVSHGLDETTFPDDPDPDRNKADCITYVRDRLTPALDRFMLRMGITGKAIYSIDESEPDSTEPQPGDRAIYRLQGWADGDWWEAGKSVRYCGVKKCHEHWGGPEKKTFWLTPITRLNKAL